MALVRSGHGGRTVRSARARRRRGCCSDSQRHAGMERNSSEKSPERAQKEQQCADHKVVSVRVEMRMPPGLPLQPLEWPVDCEWLIGKTT